MSKYFMDLIRYRIYRFWVLGLRYKVWGERCMVMGRYTRVKIAIILFKFRVRVQS